MSADSKATGATPPKILLCPGWNGASNHQTAHGPDEVKRLVAEAAQRGLMTPPSAGNPSLTLKGAHQCRGPRGCVWHITVLSRDKVYHLQSVGSPSAKDKARVFASTTREKKGGFRLRLQGTPAREIQGPLWRSPHYLQAEKEALLLHNEHKQFLQAKKNVKQRLQTAITRGALSPGQKKNFFRLLRLLKRANTPLTVEKIRKLALEEVRLLSRLENMKNRVLRDLRRLESRPSVACFISVSKIRKMVKESRSADEFRTALTLLQNELAERPRKST